MSLRIALLLLALAAGGCTWVGDYLAGEDNAIPPSELVPIESPLEVTRVWEARVGKGLDDAFVRLMPAVGAGRVFAASHDGIVAAHDAVTGKALWRVKTDLEISAGVGLSQDAVLVGTAEGEVLALARSDGQELWRTRVSSEVLAPPRAEQGVVVVRTVDGRFTGLQADSGNRLWLYEHSVPTLTLRGMAPPLLAQGAVITGLDTGRLLVLSLSNGAPVWERTVAPPRGRTELERMVDIDSELKVVGDVLYAAAYQGNVSAISLRDGTTLWSRDLSSYAGLDADAARVYVSDEEDAVWALDRRSGASLWKQPGLRGRRLTAPVVTGEHVVVGDLEGYLHWIETSSGAIVGRSRLSDAPLAASPVSIDGLLHAYGAEGHLGAFRLAGGR